MSTIKEVAKLAGVSVASVSRYVNNTTTVSAETAERISDAIKALNYHPNSIGRSLRTTKSNYILALVPSIENNFLSRVIKGIQNVGNKLGYSIIIGLTQSDKAIEQSYLDLIKSRGVDGIIAISPVVPTEELCELFGDYPLIQCSEYSTPDIPYITIDNRAAAREMVGKLIVSGCKRVAMISTDIDLISVKARVTGYKEALEAHGIPFDENLLIHAPLGFNGGRRAAEELMKYHPDAIFAAADILALGAIKYLRDKGINVPGEVSVAGFDGIQRARESTPTLTTVLQPAYDIGKTAAQMIIDLIDGKEISNRTILPYRVVLRQSTKIE